jgi:hypothetical protein
VLTVIGALVVVLIAGCGSGTGGSATTSERARVNSGSSPAAPAAGPELASGGSGTDSGKAAVVPPGIAKPDPAPGGARDQAPSPAQQPVAEVGRALVKTAQLSVEVKDLGAASRQVRTAAAGAGAFVTEEKTGSGGSLLVLRVPADKLDGLIEAVTPIGTVKSRNAQVVDATDQLVDLDSRVATQQASVARVRALLAQAKEIGEIVSIESELSRREGDLDSLTRRLTALRDKVALSTLTVDLRGPDSAPMPVEEKDGGFLAGLAAGWNGLMGLGVVLGQILGFLLPFVPVIAVLLGIWWLIRRNLRARRVPAPAGAGAGGRSGPGSEGES